MRLFDFLFPPRVDELVLRDTPPEKFLALLAPRLVPLTRPSTVALLPFGEGRVRSAIHEAKYHGSEHAFHLLALALADYLRDSDDGFRKPIIVPVPLGRERHKKRKFNQVREVILRALGSLEEGAGFKIDSTIITRTRETPSQVSLPRHTREKNMRGAFLAVHPASASATYILIDDVLTTGATLQAAIDALTEAGATHIVPLALAH